MNYITNEKQYDLINSIDFITTMILSNYISAIVQQSLNEDIGSGDITADLISDDKISEAFVISRDNAVVCGVDWVNETFRQVDQELCINWHCNDSDHIEKDALLFTIIGSSKKILTGERTALNMPQVFIWNCN